MAFNWQNNKPITLLINSPGGDIYAGNAIYDAVKASKAKVTGVVIGHAMSAAATIFQACSRRIMTKNSRLLFHHGTWTVNDGVKNLRAWATEAASWEKWDEELLAVTAFESLEAAKAFLSNDAIVDAPTAVELGLADEVAK
jgi:ATP-dependent Clp protease protease subunit